MRLILLGKPGCGKGTQSVAIASRYEIPAVSTGDLIRAAIKDGTELGREFQGFTSKGALVPDRLVLDMVQERLDQADCTQGFLLDGFPRTVPQADALEAMLEAQGKPLDKVVYLDVPDEILVRRATGRRYCPKSGATYHIEFNPPTVDGICDVSGGPLLQREDDQEAVVVARLQEYGAKTAPLVEYYNSRGKLVKVDGVGEVADVQGRIYQSLQ